MSGNNKGRQLAAEIRNLLKRFEPGGDLGAIQDRDEWDSLVKSLPAIEAELLQELSNFADLWRYLREQRQPLGPHVVLDLIAAAKLPVAERIERMRQINQMVMERITDAGQGPQFRN